MNKTTLQSLQNVQELTLIETISNLNSSAEIIDDHFHLILRSWEN